MRKLLVIGGIGALLLAGCGGSEEEGEGGGGGATQIWPLAVGNWWAYQDVNDTSNIDTTFIVGDTVYNGHEGYTAVIQGDSASDTAVVYYADGYLWMVKVVTIDTITDTVEMKWLKEDPEVGDQWTAYEKRDTIQFQGMPAEFHVLVTAKVEGKEDKSVPAGDFSGCFVVRYDNLMEVLINGNPVYSDKSANKMWVYPGVGSVYGSDSSDASGWQDSQLYDYELK